VGLHRWLGAILVTSVLLVACGRPPQPGGTTAATTTTTTTSSTTAPATTAPPATPTPAATVSASGTPSAATTPGASGTPVAAAGGVEADYANAEGLMGYEEVQKLAAPASTPDSVAKGKELFAGKGNCVSCHGADGKGDGPAGAALDPPPRNLHAKAEYKYGAGDHGVYRTVFYGVDGTGMAPLEGVLSSEEIWNVVHYVHTLQ
jgi:mono/diheme cytochrome c family protein